jgi:hypothetical protein
MNMHFIIFIANVSKEIIKTFFLPERAFKTPYGTAEIEPGYLDGGIHIACGTVR